MVDCEKCVHHEDSSYCEECEHYDRDLSDYYEEATPEIIAKREEAKRLLAEKEAIDEWIPVEISDEFREAFNLAKKYAAREHFREVLLGVYISLDNCLVASDSHQLIEIPCGYIPEELLGKCVIKLDENQAGIHTKQGFPVYRHFFSSDEYVMGKVQFSPLQNPKEKQYFEVFGFEVELLILKDHEIAFQKKYLDLMRGILTGDITAYYNPENKLAPVLFVGDNAKMVIVPLRRHTD